VTRGLLVSGFLCNSLCPAILHLLCPLLGALYLLCQILFGEWGGEVAATEPDLGAGRQTGNGKIMLRHSLDRLNASVNEQKKNRIHVMTKVMTVTFLPSMTGSGWRGRSVRSLLVHSSFAVPHQFWSKCIKNRIKWKVRGSRMSKSPCSSGKTPPSHLPHSSYPFGSGLSSGHPISAPPPPRRQPHLPSNEERKQDVARWGRCY